MPDIFEESSEIDFDLESSIETFTFDEIDMEFEE